MKNITDYDFRYYDHINKQYILIDSDNKRNLNFFDSSFQLTHVDTAYNIAAYREKEAALKAEKPDYSRCDPSRLFTYYQFCDPQFFEDQTAVFKWARFSSGIGNSYAFFYDLKEKRVFKIVNFEISDDILNQFSCNLEIVYYKPKDKFYYLATLPEIPGYRLFECDGSGKLISELQPGFVIYYPFIRFVYMDKMYFVNREYIMTVDGDNRIEKIPLQEPVPPNTYFNGFFDYDKKVIVADNADFDRRRYNSKAPVSSYEITLDGKVTALPLMESRFKKIISYLAKKEADEIKNMPKEKTEKKPKVVTEWDKYPKVKISWTDKMFADEEKGILYCVGDRIFSVDLNTHKKLGSFKTVSNQNQVLCSEERTFFITKSTVGDFAVFYKENFEMPAWRFKLKVDNTDSDFVLHDHKLFGEATASIGGEGLYRKYFIIDLATRSITYSMEERDLWHLTPEQREHRRQLIKTYKPKGEIPADIGEEVKNVLKTCKPIPKKIPDEFKSVEHVTDYYENEKFQFVSSWDYLMIIGKGSAAAAAQAVDEPSEDSETYIRENGMTSYAFENYSEEEIMHGGYLWAIDSIEQKEAKAGENLSEYLGGGGDISKAESILYSIGRLVAEMDNGGFEQYLFNSNEFDFSLLVKNLKTVGAIQTARIIERAVRLQAGYDSGNVSEDSFAEKVETLSGELEAEDYIGLAVKYLKRN